MQTQPYDVRIQEVIYGTHTKTPLRARIFQPLTDKIVPGVVQVHGGMWCEYDRQKDSILNIAVAQSGVIVVSIDLRAPPEAAYPASIADSNYAVRWLKANAQQFGTRADLIGIMGSSTGGHVAMLTAMRPKDPRYAAIPNPPNAKDFSSSVPWAVLCYPAIDPLARYRYAQQLIATGDEWGRKFGAMVKPRHDLYWGNEAAMAEGNPVALLQGTEKLELPPIYCVQSDGDRAHPWPSLRQFVELYRRAGGMVTLRTVHDGDSDFLNTHPGMPAAVQATTEIIDFIHSQTEILR